MKHPDHGSSKPLNWRDTPFHEPFRKSVPHDAQREAFYRMGTPPTRRGSFHGNASRLSPPMPPSLTPPLVLKAHPENLPDLIFKALEGQPQLARPKVPGFQEEAQDQFQEQPNQPPMGAAPSGADVYEDPFHPAHQDFDPPEHAAAAQMQNDVGNPMAAQAHQQLSADAMSPMDRASERFGPQPQQPGMSHMLLNNETQMPGMPPPAQGPDQGKPQAPPSEAQPRMGPVPGMAMTPPGDDQPGMPPPMPGMPGMPPPMPGMPGMPPPMPGMPPPMPGMSGVGQFAPPGMPGMPGAPPTTEMAPAMPGAEQPISLPPPQAPMPLPGMGPMMAPPTHPAGPGAAVPTPGAPAPGAPPTHGGYQGTPVQPTNGPAGGESKPDPFDMESEEFAPEGEAGGDDFGEEGGFDEEPPEGEPVEESDENGDNEDNGGGNGAPPWMKSTGANMTILNDLGVFKGLPLPRGAGTSPVFGASAKKPPQMPAFRPMSKQPAKVQSKKPKMQTRDPAPTLGASAKEAPQMPAYRPATKKSIPAWMRE